MTTKTRKNSQPSARKPVPFRKPSMLAIVRKDAFHANLKDTKQDGVFGEVMPWVYYPTQNQFLDKLYGGSLFLVTVRPNDTLWLVSIFERTEVYEKEDKKRRWVEIGIKAREENTTPITDITDLKRKLVFKSGNGIRGEPGKLGQELQTPRVLTKDDEKLLRDAVAAATPTTPKKDEDQDDPLGGFEGAARMHFVTHRTREKKRREAKLTEVKNAKGKLCCEAPGCGFDFFATYGEVGEDYIHVHHIKPLASRLAPEKTPLADLVLVCANCHAMIHRGGQCRPLQGLLTKTTAKKAPPIAKRPTSR